MAIIKAKRGNVIYIYEVNYVGIKDGKRQYKKKSLGHLDEAGNFIPSKKMRGKKPEDFPAEIQKITTTTTKIRVVEKKESDSREKEKAEPIEPEIVKPPHNDYTLMQQGIATNKLSKIKSREKDVKIDPVTGTGIMTWDDFTVAMKNFKEIAGFRTSTHKLLDALMIEFTETGGKDTKITLSLKKLMELRGLKNEKSARQQTEEDLETLYNASISFNQKSKGRKDFLDMRLVIDKGIKNGIVQCTFHPDFYGLMKTYQVMPMNKKALALDDRYNPNAYYFLREFCEHMNMNYSKPNKNLISVMTLLKSTPEIPTYEELEKTNRQYKQKIIDPFERDLNKLEEIRAITWEYCHTNALPLSDEELKEMDYEIFHKLLIHFELIDYPQRDNSKKSLQVKNNQKKVLKKAQKNA